MATWFFLLREGKGIKEIKEIKEIKGVKETKGVIRNLLIRTGECLCHAFRHG